ncbi:MAG: PAS domain-containing protein [Chloroflexi bacterium]|nr:PAS domain-containing protein [Chloroflexota bacterium]
MIARRKVGTGSDRSLFDHPVPATAARSSGERQVQARRVTLDGIYQLLATAQFGAYVVSLDQTIVYWNQAAERILGFPRDQVVGRRCYDVLTGLAPGGFTPECLLGCPSLRALRGGEIPQARELRMLSASGDRKGVSLTPMVIATADHDSPVLVHLFEESAHGETSDEAADSVRGTLLDQGAEMVTDGAAAATASPGGAPLTPRELEVLRLVAAGWSTQRIADGLEISPHTVRNHVRHFRAKLNATTKLDAVVTGIRIGIL